MAQYQFHEDFSLGGIFLSEVGGTIINTENDKRTWDFIPNIEHSTDKDSVNNGERYIQSRYQPRTIDLTLFFQDYVDLAFLRSWIAKDEEQVFYYRDDEEHKEIDVIYNKDIPLEAYYGQKFHGELDVSFIAYNPIWRVRGEYERKFNNITIGKEILLKSNGNIKSSPILRIKVPSIQQQIKLQFNDLIITLKNITNEIYINSKLGEVYEYSNGIKSYQMIKYESYNYRMPVLFPFKDNKIKLLEGNISEIGVTLNSEIL